MYSLVKYSEKGVRLVQNMQVGPCIHVGIQFCAALPPPPDRGLPPRRPQNKEVLAISDDGLGRQATMCTDKD